MPCYCNPGTNYVNTDHKNLVTMNAKTHTHTPFLLKTPAASFAPL